MDVSQMQSETEEPRKLDIKETNSIDTTATNFGFGGIKTVALLEEGQTDTLYQMKAQLLNDAIQEIGMGKYQWHLFMVAGFGWFSDNLWPVATSLIFTPVVYEFAPKYGPELTLGQNSESPVNEWLMAVGLLVGAFGWGLGCDIIGRRWAFNITLCITGIFGIIGGSAPTFTAIATFATLWSIGVGGNLYLL